jgi:hypothetical protein
VALQQIKVPHARGYDFGIGVDRLAGAAMNQVVKPTPSSTMSSSGAIQSFQVSRLYSTRDLQKKLGIDIDASYGCAMFGAGASARFGYMQDSSVHSSSLFMSVTATVHQADLSIDLCELTESAAQVVDRPDIFDARYGNMFCRSCSRGGLFVAVMKIETRSESEANSMEYELKGSYGLFSAEAQAKFSSVTSEHQASVYCNLYAEGGPALSINDPHDPKELLKNANAWMQAMHNDPNRNSVPYEWTLSPITIAEGPMPLNEADIQHGQDVLQVCARARTSILDQLNLLSWIHDHRERFDWTGPVTPEQVTAAVRGTEGDLDIVARCASHAIDNPKVAVLPARYAADRGETYPAGIVPTPLPKPLVPREFLVPTLIGHNMNAVENDPAYAPYREQFNLAAQWVEDYAPPADQGKIFAMDPMAGTRLTKGSTVICKAHLYWSAGGSG